MRLRTIAAGLTLLLVSLPARGADAAKEPPKPSASFEIPYRLTDTKHVMVRVKLNGKGPFNFILDTGAPAMIISEAVAKKASGKLEKGWNKFKLDIEGGLTLPEAKGLALDMFQLKGMNSMGVAGVELHGVLGYGILAKYRIQYDFTSDKLVWSPLKFDPPEIERIGKGDGSQGGLEMVGNLMKLIAPLMGLRPNFEVKPRGFLGLELEESKGDVLVKSVVKDSPAAKAGLKAGDRLDHARNRSVESMEDVLNAVGGLGEGDKLFLRIKRDGEKKDLTIELGKGL
jgi:serine protease DegQ